MDGMEARKRYTYTDYASWNDENRCELIDGVAYMLSPAPGLVHQEILGVMHARLFNFLQGKPCKVFVSPFDVRLNAAGDNDDTVVQPDLVVICDKSKLDDKGCNGAPDMIIEILSPSTASRDRVLKFNKYLQAAVREYWIVDPESNSISVFILENGKYIASVYMEKDNIPVHVLEGCVINLTEVFAR